MAETDILNDLMSSNPNAPASNGMVLLLRAETKSEFKTLRSEMNRGFSELRGDITKMQGDVHQLKSSMELVAQQVAVLVSRR